MNKKMFNGWNIFFTLFFRIHITLDNQTEQVEFSET